jgi:uncharacterized membrane protein
MKTELPACFLFILQFGKIDCMDKERRTIELQEKIDNLSKDIQSFQQELFLLQNELNALKNNKQNNENTKPVLRSSPASGNHTGLENYIGLKFMHLAGIIVLVTGLSIGVKYAIDKRLISEIMRIISAYAAGAALFLLSFRLKKKYQLFSAILFSGSMASVYFTTYAASVYYNFFPVPVAFAIMTGLTVYTVFAAISYNRQEIAILGMIGAYGTPFLISANAERIDLFFSYILLINIGVVFISFRRSWKLMQYLALLITWILFTGWAFLRYESSTQSIGILFMLAYYVLFILSAVARQRRLSGRLSPGEIQQIIINNTALYLATILVFGNGGFEIHLATTTGFAALFTASLAALFTLLFPSEIVVQRMIAWQAIILVVLFTGFQWQGVTVTLLWIAAAVILFTWGIIYKKSWPRLASILLITITLGKLVIFDSANFSTVQKIISFLVIGVLLLLFSFYYQKFNLLNTKQGGEK